jgi:hypothetical protein
VFQQRVTCRTAKKRALSTGIDIADAMVQSQYFVNNFQNRFTLSILMHYTAGKHTLLYKIFTLTPPDIFGKELRILNLTHASLGVFICSVHLRALHLVVALYSLRVAWRNIGAWARRLCWRGSRGSDKAVLLTRELSIWCVVHSAVSLLTSALSTTRRILRLALDVIVGHVSLLLIVDLLVGWIGRYGDDVPCVEETGEEAEHCWNCQLRVLQMLKM